jgi:hypothetical protein
MAPRTRFSGRVVDARTGRPLTRFEIEEEIGTWGSSSLRPEFQLVEDQLGQFEYRSVRSGEVTLRVRAEGYAVAHEVFSGVEPGGEITGVELALQPGGTVSGVVRAVDGAPIAGARVSLVVDGVASHLTTTDDTGAFAAKHALLGAELRVIHGNFADSVVPLVSWQDLDVTLIRGGAIEGVVTLNGEAIADAIVRLHNEETGYSASSKTGANGAFMFAQVPPGAARIECSVYVDGTANSHVVTVEIVDESVSEVSIDFQN